MFNIWEEIIRLNSEGLDGILITVIEKKDQGHSIVGKKMLIDANGTAVGSIGGGELESLAVNKARELMSQHEHGIETYNLSDEQPFPTNHNLNIMYDDFVTLFFEYIPVHPTLYIIGMGHVGRCLDKIMSTLDWDIIRVNYSQEAENSIQDESRPTIKTFPEIMEEGIAGPGCYIVIAGFSPEEDYQVLEAFYRAKWNPRYIGLLASAKKASLIVKRLINELGTDIDLSVLHTPAGLDIGGNKPEEMAVSVAAEIQALYYGKRENRHLGANWSIKKL